MAEEATEKKIKEIRLPYLSWKTINNFIGSFKDREIPNRIDASILPNLSNSIKALILPSLRYLKLVNESNHPSDTFKKLAKTSDESERKEILQSVIKDAYSFLFADDFNLAGATTQEFEGKFKEIGLTGEIYRKAATFFLTAAKDAGIKVSPYIKLWQGVVRPGELKARKKSSAAQNNQGNGESINAENQIAEEGKSEGQISESKQTRSGHLSKFLLSGDKVAEIYIPDTLTRRDAQKLKKALQGFTFIIDSLIDEDDEDDAGGNE